MTPKSEQLMDELAESILDAAKQVKKEGYKQDAFAMAAAVVLTRHLVHAFELIESLGDRITTMELAAQGQALRLAELEAKQ